MSTASALSQWHVTQRRDDAGSRLGCASKWMGAVRIARALASATATAPSRCFDPSHILVAYSAYSAYSAGHFWTEDGRSGEARAGTDGVFACSARDPHGAMLLGKCFRRARLCRDVRDRSIKAGDVQYTDDYCFIHLGVRWTASLSSPRPSDCSSHLLICSSAIDRSAGSRGC